MRAYAVTVGREASAEMDAPAGPCQVVETARVALVFYPQAGLLIVQSRRPRTGAVILDMGDVSDEALALLRAFAGGG